MALIAQAPTKLVIVGCGITGALTLHLIQREKKNFDVQMWEANRDTGGRMSTVISPDCEVSRADLGAQYITTSLLSIRNHAQFYEELLEAGVLKSLKGKIEGLRKPLNKALNFIAPNGMGSIVRHFAFSEGCNLSYNERVSKIELDIANNKWMVTTTSGKSDAFDAVLLTIPIPDILEVEGLKQVLEGRSMNGILQKVQYSSRFALALFYKSPQEYFEKIPWIAKYFDTGEVIRFISVDHKKRENYVDQPSIVVHSTVEFGEQHLADDVQNVQNLLLSELQTLLPELPSPSHMICHTWKYSQVTKGYPARCGCIVISENPLLIIGGDAFTESTFDGCIDSAVRIVEETLKHMC